MNTQDKFPQSLLQNSIDVRKEYFCRKTINHPRLEMAKNDILSLADTSGKRDIIIVTGPTGVGKTTLAVKTED
jgi:flagellar biosynthesis GTPase FlhF